jgi:hypothetical protein
VEKQDSFLKHLPVRTVAIKINLISRCSSLEEKKGKKTSNLFPADDINAEDCFTQHMLRLHSVPATINQCCGSGMFIPDPNFSIPDPDFFHPGSRIRIKKFKYFNSKKWFLSFPKYDPSCSSRIRIPNPDPNPDSVSQKTRVFFAPCYSQSFLLADFQNPYKKIRETRKLESIHEAFCRTDK